MLETMVYFDKAARGIGFSGRDVVDKLKRREPVTDPDKMVKVQVASDIK